MAAEPWPFVSVVLPVRNEAPYIRRCLKAVLRQDYPADRFEVIVADGMSTDGTASTLQAMARRHNRLRVLANPGQIVPTALNLAIRESRGDVIVRVDGHCEVAPDYLRRCVEHLRDGVDAVGGPLQTIGQTPMASTIALAMSSTFGVGNAAFRTVSDRTLMVDTVAFPAYTRRVLERLGPFDEELVRNQDDEYNYRLRSNGGVIRLASDVRSRYYSRGSLRSLWRQYFQYGYWKVRVLQKHPRQMYLRQFVPPAFVATLALLALLAGWPMARSALLFVIALYAAAALLQACRLAWRTPSRLVRLPLVFATVHVAYGLGFLVGLIAFRGRWRTPPQSPLHATP